MKLDANKILKAILSNKGLQADIMELNTRFQLFEKGIDRDGFLLGTYSLATELISGGVKIHGQHYTFLDTGKFLASWRFYNQDKSFTMDADPMKDNGVNLFEKYGEQLIGFTDEHLQLIIEWIQDAFKPVLLGYLQTGDYFDTGNSAAVARTRAA